MVKHQFIEPSRMIIRDKSKDPPVATYGRIKKKFPWEIKDNKLKAKDYYYEI